MDLTAEKAKRDARIKAKESRIKNELGTTENNVPAPELASLPEGKEEKK